MIIPMTMTMTTKIMTFFVITALTKLNEHNCLLLFCRRVLLWEKMFCRHRCRSLSLRHVRLIAGRQVFVFLLILFCFTTYSYLFCCISNVCVCVCFNLSMACCQFHIASLFSFPWCLFLPLFASFVLFCQSSLQWMNT